MILKAKRNRNQPAKSERYTLLKLLAYTATAWRLLIALFVCIVLRSFLELAGPWVIGFMLLDGVIKRSAPGELPLVVALLTGIFLAHRCAAYLQDYFYQLANQRIVHELRCDLFEHVERVPLRFFEKHRTGELLSRITGDVNAVEGLLDTLVKDLAAEVVMLIGTLAFLFSVNARLTFYVLPTIPALALSVFCFKRVAKIYARRVRELMGEMAGLAGEAIAGVQVVKAFCGEEFEANRFASKSLELLRANLKTAKLQSFYLSTIELWGFAGTMVVILVATPQVIEGSFTVGALVAYFSYLNKLYGPAKTLSRVNFFIQKILAAGERIFEVLDTPAETESEKDDVNRTARSGIPQPIASRDGRSPIAITGAVRFEHVSFAYEDERLVLRDFNLDVAPGEIIALVGRSGGGKTTVANLLLRFCRPTSGRIFCDDLPLDMIPFKTWRNQIGLVQQEIFLFSGTLRDNIAYANPQASDEQIVSAARAAYAHDFIMQLPQGYLTQVGERGAKLSGGQRQRIAIARALLLDPRILIFDEATSHLDSESEQLVQQALQRVAEGRTVFCIAHRLSSIWQADRIVVVEHGEILQTGKHTELLIHSELYRRLYDLQARFTETVRNVT